jgi:hypothetical protein
MKDKAATSRRTPNDCATLKRETIWSAATCRRFSPMVGARIKPLQRTFRAQLADLLRAQAQRRGQHFLGVSA